ncbi:CPBP family intramembrane glutamic endopeptidase [Bacillus cereus group sp. BfR-BA-01380]|uniref:CPBP family intramembrane glutamic endopeptidase n=1 Tax=Bacillus cereus group sp. BfR-BA-01380 TaxID=2920324 RepID=UPI001F586D70|nr:CPBP family intramembrane glutamic endopeptidase [Bacillus cereus group sp. BfR-BA-01380]
MTKKAQRGKFMTKSTKKIFTYLTLIVLLTGYSYYAIISKGTLKGNEGYVFELMWAPAIAAFLTKLIYDKNIKGFGFKPGKLKYLAFGYFLPLASCLIVYSAVWITGIADVKSPNILQVIVLATLGVMYSCLSAAGEEIGWRGFMVPELLKENSFLKTSLIAALIWYLYHCPLILFADYSSEVEKPFVLICFAFSMISVTFIANYLRVRSNSVWPTIILHASHNLFVQALFDEITISKGISRYITTEFGAGLALLYSLAAILVIIRYKKEVKNSSIM